MINNLQFTNYLQQMKKIIILGLILSMKTPVYAFTYDGTSVNFNGDSIVIEGEEGTMEITDEAIKVDGEDGTAVITDDDVTVTSDEGEMMVMTEDTIEVTGGDWEVSDDGLMVDGGDEFGALVIESENGIKVEDEGTESGLTLVTIEEDKVYLTDGQQEYLVQIGLTGIKVSDEDSSVVVYYGASGIESSNILVGDKTGTIYLATDFGEKKIGAMPNNAVKRLKYARKLDPIGVEFGWDLEGEDLQYLIRAEKVEKFLGLIPTTIHEINYYSIESGVLVKTEKSAWHSFMDWLSF